MKSRAHGVLLALALAGAAGWIDACTEAQAEGARRSRPPALRVTESQSPRPQDRLFYAYNYFQMTVEGGGSFGQTSFDIDPGAFVPVRETIGFEQTFLGGSIEFNLLPFLGRPPLRTVPAPGTVIGPGLVFGVNGRVYFGDGAQRGFDLFAVSGEVSHTPDWSVTGYVGFPIVTVQPSFFPGIDTFTITPLVGVTYQEDTIGSFQVLQFGNFRNENLFEQSFGRTGATIGLNFDAARGNFLFGVTSGVTLLPEADVSGISSLGQIGQANIDAQVSIFLGARAGYRFATDAILTY